MQVQTLKSCCARFYEQRELRTLLGDCWHPGGLDLTVELGSMLKLGPEDRILDVASGLGSTGRILHKNFQCSVTAIDLSETILSTASAFTADLPKHFSLCRCDSENLPFRNHAFDAIFCECSLCMFPSKETAAAEMFRVLNHKGQTAISDMTLEGELSDELRSSLHDFLCITEARPKRQYHDLFAQTGFVDIQTFDKSGALLVLLENLRKALFAAELLIGLKKISLALDSVNRAKTVLKEVTIAAKNGIIGYVALIASKP